MKTKNDMRGITHLVSITPFLFLVLALFACTGGNPVNKNDEKAQKYIKELDHKDLSVQIRAAMELGRLKYKGAVKPLMKKLDSPDPEVKEYALTALGMLKARNSLKKIIKLLGDKDKKVKMSAVRALGEIGDPAAANHLYLLTNDRDAEIREAAFESLGELKDMRVFEGLSHPDDDVRDATIFSIARNADRRMARHLFNLLNDKNSRIHSEICEIIQFIRNPGLIDILIDGLNHEDPAAREAVVLALSNFKEPRVIKPLFQILIDGNSRLRELAAKGIINNEEPVAIQSRLADLKSPDLRKRVLAILSIKWQMGNIVIKPVIESLTDESEFVRQAAMDFLYKNSYKHDQFGPPPPPPPGVIYDVEANRSFELEVRKELSQLREPGIIKQIRLDLKSGNHQLGSSAAGILSRIGCPDAASLLLKQLEKKRFYVINALGEIGDPAGVMPLINTLKVTEDEYILAEAVSALTQIGDQRAVEPIKELFDSKANMVIYSVLKAVCKFRIPDSIEFIRKIIKRGQQNIFYDIIDYALYALLVVSPPEFKKSIHNELKDYNLYQLTPIILEHRDREAAKNLLPLLTDIGLILEIARLCDLKDLRSMNIIPRLTKHIKASSNYYYREAEDALKLLARVDHDTAAEPLIQLLKKVYSDYTESTADLLAKNTSKKVSSLLTRELEDGNSRIRALSAEILGVRRERAAVPSLIKVLNEKNRKLRINSLLALGKISDPGSIPTVAKYLENQDFYIRCTAAKTLLYFNTSSCVKNLEKLLKSKNPSVRSIAARILGKTGKSEPRDEEIKYNTLERKKKTTGISDIVMARDSGITLYSYNKKQQKYHKKSFFSVNFPGFVVNSRLGLFCAAGDRLYRLNSDLTLEKEITTGEIAALACSDKALLVSIEGSLISLDRDFNLKDLLDLKINPGYKKDAHDILVHENSAFLLDNVVKPFYIIKVNIRDPENMGIMKKVLVEEANQHLEAQAINPGAAEWLILQTGTTMGGHYQNLIAYSLENCRWKRGFLIGRHRHGIKKDSVYVKAMTASSPPWYVVLKNGKYFLANIHTDYTRIKYSLILDLNSEVNHPGKDKVRIKRHNHHLYISIRGKMIIVDLSGKPRIVFSQDIGGQINDFAPIGLNVNGN